MNTRTARPDSTTSVVRLTQVLKPWSGDIVDADDRQAIQFLKAGAKCDELQQIWYDLDLDAFAAGELHQAEELGVLLEGQCHI